MLIGITGGYACGKTTVAKLIAKKGAKRLDSDKIAKECLKKKTGFLHKEFPEVFVGKKNSRNKLASVVFSSKHKRRKLEMELHPAVVEKIKKVKKGKATCVVEVPLLFEAEMEKLFDVVIVVRAPLKKRLERAALPKGEAIKRIRSQMPLSEKEKRADYVIKNNDAIKVLREQIDTIWDDINA